MPRKLKAALCASAVVLVGVSMPVPSTAVGDPLPVPPVVVPVVPVAPCAGVTQAQFAKRAKKVYGRILVSRKAEASLVRMVGLACTPEAGANMAAIHKAEKARARKRRNCGSPTCNRRLGAYWALKSYGWGAQQFSCLSRLWGPLEGGWSITADNPTSSAYGIPQALPGSKMGPGWQHSATVQIRWGLRYIKGHKGYGTPCGALSRRLAQGWY